MKIKKIVAGLSAAVLAATMMSVSVSAAKLGDVVHPSEEDSKMNDSYYSIGNGLLYGSGLDLESGRLGRH